MFTPKASLAFIVLLAAFHSVTTGVVIGHCDSTITDCNQCKPRLIDRVLRYGHCVPVMDVRNDESDCYYGDKPSELPDCD